MWVRSGPGGTGADGGVTSGGTETVQVVRIKAAISGELKDGGCDKVGGGGGSGAYGRCRFVAVRGSAGDVGGFGGWDVLGGQLVPHSLLCCGGIDGLGGAGPPEGGVRGESPVL